MHLVVFGLTLSSSWGNGHATLWRGLLKALAQRGHTAVFYEKDVPYYAEARDGWALPQGIRLRLYDEIASIRAEATRELRDADAALVTSYCADGRAASRLVLDGRSKIKAFYDLDTPITLDAWNSGTPVSYLPAEGLAEFDLVLSYTGGRALDELQSRLAARRVAPLYGWVDPDLHHPESAVEEFRSELSYLGTFSADRQAALEQLFVLPARAKSGSRFVIGGAQYPDSFPWSLNIYFVRHLPPSMHASFYSSGRATLNVTRRAMARYGYCPSGRLFEAAACGTAIVTDLWEGLEDFFTPGIEILPVRDSQDVVSMLALTDCELQAISEAGRARVLQQHTAAARAVELERILNDIF
jgi:spore maturation protein CgeB